MKKQLVLAEAIMDSMIQSLGVKKFAIVMNNVFVHGTILKEVYGTVEEKDVEEIFQGIEHFARVGERLDD